MSSVNKQSFICSFLVLSIILEFYNESIECTVTAVPSSLVNCKVIISMPPKHPYLLSCKLGVTCD